MKHDPADVVNAVRLAPPSGNVSEATVLWPGAAPAFATMVPKLQWRSKNSSHAGCADDADIWCWGEHSYACRK